jgi:hypothetical protein
MIHVVYCMRRRTDLSLQQFLDYWGNVHAPIVLQNLPTLRLVGYRRIVPRQHAMSLRVERRDISQQPYDGIAILAWENDQDFQQSLTDPQALEVQRALARDESLFIDVANSCRWVADAISYVW